MSEREPQDNTKKAMDIAQSWINQKKSAVEDGLKKFFGPDEAKISVEFSSPEKGVQYVLWSALSSKLDQGASESALRSYSNKEISKLVYDSYVLNSQT
jgi:hypothetical protein